MIRRLLYLFARNEIVLYLPLAKELLYLVIKTTETPMALNGAWQAPLRLSFFGKEGLYQIEGRERHPLSLNRNDRGPLPHVMSGNEKASLPLMKGLRHLLMHNEQALLSFSSTSHERASVLNSFLGNDRATKEPFFYLKSEDRFSSD